jgi:hypothetical protein
MTTDEIKLLIQSLQDQIKQSQEVENEVRNSKNLGNKAPV